MLYTLLARPAWDKHPRGSRKQKLSFTQGCVHQDGTVQLRRALGNAYRPHLVEPAQGVAPWQQLRHGSLPQGPGEKQDHVVDHVAVAERVVSRGGGRVIYDRREFFWGGRAVAISPIIRNSYEIHITP